MSIPRGEYPRPQFKRDEWLCLNGEWDFEFDFGNSGLERGLVAKPFERKITVPFCPESELSGIGYVDFMAAVWYRRKVDVPVEWAGKRVLLHFQAVDYDATVWVNGQELVRHRGGSTPFFCDMGDVGGQTVEIVLRARDYHNQPMPSGKQAHRYANHDCNYTRTTGIWQTVWMEPVPTVSLRRPRITPDVANSLFILEQPLTENAPGLKLRATVFDHGNQVSQAECCAAVDLSPRLYLPIAEADRKLWGPGEPNLYDLKIELIDADGSIVDSAMSYAGLRSIAIQGKKVLINGKSVFQRQVLDQGYYPDGILTAPSDEALIRDIELSMAVGFNSARLHQKVFEERFLYHADRLGYLVWGEFCDWGAGGYGPTHDHQKQSATFITQWVEEMERDYSHPSIIGWCPLNETWQVMTDQITQLDDVTWGMYQATKAIDSTRPVLDASGYSHRVYHADIYDSHDYTQDLETFRKHHSTTTPEGAYRNTHEDREISIPYVGQPYFLSEFGGIWWNEELARQAAAGNRRTESWGYGNRPNDIEEFYTRFEGMCDTLLDNPDMFAYCYTQLTDVFQEMNGIFYFDRGEKFDLERLRKIQTRKAAIED